MLMRLYKAEKLKLRRSPVWLLFIVVPAVPAFLGTMNYLYNIEILTSEWYSLWTQHTLFTSYFFLPILVGLYCSYLIRLEKNNRNVTKMLTLPVSRKFLSGKAVIRGENHLFDGGLDRAVIFNLRKADRHSVKTAHKRIADLVCFRSARGTGYGGDTTDYFPVLRQFCPSCGDILCGRADRTCGDGKGRRTYVSLFADGLRHVFQQ